MKLANHGIIGAASLALIANIALSGYNTHQLNELKISSSSKIDELKQSLRSTKLYETNQSGLIELASNNRMATIVAYQIKNGASLRSLVEHGYLDALSTAFKEDFIDDNLYARLAAFNANAEYVVNSSTTRLIRGKWEAQIALGSHFDLHPQGRLLLPSESVNIPHCASGSMPYIAYVIASPIEQDPSRKAEIDIKEENGVTPQYRFTLKINDMPEPFNTQYRILADVGCSNIPTEINDKAGMTN